MIIQENFSLKNENTFGVEVVAKYFVVINSVSDLRKLFSLPEFHDEKKLFLGGGSNILFTKDFDGIVIKNSIRGIEVVREDDNFIWVKAMSGENWHNFVVHVVEKGWGGIENLSLIPGTVGAAPVQNIGAYGVEIKDTLENVETFEIETGKEKTFTADECQFAYRNSIFKTTEKGKYFITAITLRLHKTPQINTAYGAIQSMLEEMDIENPTASDVSRAVIQIRRSKLPDPVEIGNAGSFFKNPMVSAEKLKQLKKYNNEIPFYELPDGTAKIPAAWFIEQLGWKGKRIGNTGSHEKQPLVLVNHGGATGAEIQKLAEQIQESVKEKFDVDLVPEVTIL